MTETSWSVTIPPPTTEVLLASIVAALNGIRDELRRLNTRLEDVSTPRK